MEATQAHWAVVALLGLRRNQLNEGARLGAERSYHVLGSTVALDVVLALKSLLAGARFSSSRVGSLAGRGHGHLAVDSFAQLLVTLEHFNEFDDSNLVFNHQFSYLLSDASFILSEVLVHFLFTSADLDEDVSELFVKIVPLGSNQVQVLLNVADWDLGINVLQVLGNSLFERIVPLRLEGIRWLLGEEEGKVLKGVLFWFDHAVFVLFNSVWRLTYRLSYTIRVVLIVEHRFFSAHLKDFLHSLVVFFVFRENIVVVAFGQGHRCSLAALLSDLVFLV